MLQAASYDAQSMHAWVRSQPLPTGGLIRESTEPEKLAEEISLIANLKTFDSLVGSSHFLHRSSILLLGDIAFTSAAFMPQCGETSDCPQALIELPLTAGGHTKFQAEGKTWHCIPNQQGLFLPGQAMKAVTEQSTCMLGYNLEPSTLAKFLETLAPHRFSARKARLFVERPHIIKLDDPRVKSTTTWLFSFIKLMANRDLMNPISNSLLIPSYEQMLYRATALMLCPDLMPGFH